MLPDYMLLIAMGTLVTVDRYKNVGEEKEEKTKEVEDFF